MEQARVTPPKPCAMASAAKILELAKQTKFCHPKLAAGERRMAGSTGLEPAASAVTGRRSSQLNYDPKN